MSLDFGNMNWDNLQENLDAGSVQKKKAWEADPREWKLPRDENDNGGAIIRLIPDKNGKPFIKRFTHAFSKFSNTLNKKVWYIEPSPSSINKPCPVSEKWTELMNEGTDAAKSEAKMFNRRVEFITNIKVIKDPMNPQNEGKIMYWKFGSKLNDKFIGAMNPSAADRSMGQEPLELYNPFKGANILLKIKKVAGFLNYDDTTFAQTSSIYDSQEEAKVDIIENSIDLTEFNNDDAFKTYEELSDKMRFVLSGGQKKTAPQGSEPVETETVQETNQEVSTGLDLGSSGKKDEPKIETKAKAPVEDDLSFLDDL